MRRLILLFTAIAGMIIVPGCGGGGSTSTVGTPSAPSSPGSPSSSPITITTDQILPGGLHNQPYTVTLHVANAEGAVTWTAAPFSSTALFIEGLSLNSATGVVSGSPTYFGTAGFFATVKDSANHTATKAFYLTARPPLTAAASYNATLGLYMDGVIAPQYDGGVPPYTITFGTIPPGFRLNIDHLQGTATASGKYPITVTIRDSYSTPEVVTQLINVDVLPPPLQLVPWSLPPRLPANVPFSGFAVARGGVPPYTFTAGAAPPGLTFDTATGRLSGTPTQIGSYGLQVHVQDSSQPSARTADGYYSITVGAGYSRNDTVQTATPLGNGYFQASLSPYIDPPNKAPLPADNDYYKLVSVAGSIVGVRTSAKEYAPYVPTDTVLEIVDANGVRLNTCRAGGSNAAFVSPCMNDDVSSSLQDSSLEIKMPGTASQASTVYAHILDWRGMARPDFTYNLIIGGVVTPMTIPTQTVKPAAINKPHNYQLNVANAQGAVTWSITGGSLPPGITMDPAGAISGTATALGTYPFTVQVTDSTTPPQVATADLQMQVVSPVTITSPAIWPDACKLQPYSFTIQVSGGATPYTFGFFSPMWPAINLDSNTGTFKSIPAGLNVTGTFTGTVGVGDQTGNGAQQTVQVTVKDCP